MSKSRKILFAFSAAALLVFLWLLWSIVFTATIEITGPSDSKIYAKQSDGQFEYLGDGTATFKTKSTDVVFIEARLDEKVTQKSVVPQRRKTVKVVLEIDNLAQAKRIADGPIIYPLITSDYIFGINPVTNGLTFHPLNAENKRAPSLPLLPYLKQVVWFSDRDYIFVTLGRGTGVVKGGVFPKADDRYSFFGAAMLPDKKGAALLRQSELYFSNGLDIKSPKKVASLNDKGAHRVYADNNFAYGTTLLYEPTEYKGPGVEAETEGPRVGKENELIVFDGSGNKVYNTIIPSDQPIQSVVSTDKENLFVLAGSKIYKVNIKKNSVTAVAFGFEKAKDMITFDGKVYMLSSQGLWKFDHAADSFKKIASYPPNEEYVPFSLAVNGRSLIFSSKSNSRVPPKSSASLNSVYKVDL